jgi:hypothetical protein
MFFCERLRGKKIMISDEEISKSEAFWAGLSSTQILENHFENVYTLDR